MNDTCAEHPIKLYRNAKGLSQEAFGAMVGRKKAAVCKWENGVGPNPKTAIEIEEKTEGALPRHVVRPDLWDAPENAEGSS